MIPHEIGRSRRHHHQSQHAPHNKERKALDAELAKKKAAAEASLEESRAEARYTRMEARLGVIDATMDSIQSSIETVDASTTTKFGSPIPSHPLPLGAKFDDRLEKLEKIASRLELRSVDFKKAFESYERDAKVKDEGNVAWRKAEQKVLDKQADDVVRREEALRSQMEEADRKLEKALQILALAEEKERAKIQYRVETREERKLRLIAEARKKPAGERDEYHKQLSAISREEDEEALKARSDEHERRVAEEQNEQERRENGQRRGADTEQTYSTHSDTPDSLLVAVADAFVHLIAASTGTDLPSGNTGTWWLLAIGGSTVALFALFAPCVLCCCCYRRCCRKKAARSAKSSSAPRRGGPSVAGGMSGGPPPAPRNDVVAPPPPRRNVDDMPPRPEVQMTTTYTGFSDYPPSAPTGYPQPHYVPQGGPPSYLHNPPYQQPLPHYTPPSHPASGVSSLGGSQRSAEPPGPVRHQPFRASQSRDSPAPYRPPGTNPVPSQMGAANRTPSGVTSGFAAFD